MFVKNVYLEGVYNNINRAFIETLLPLQHSRLQIELPSCLLQRTVLSLTLCPRGVEIKRRINKGVWPSFSHIPTS